MNTASNLKNRFQDYGLTHFTTTYGLADGNPTVGIVFGSGKSGHGQTLRILETEFSGKHEGWIEYDNLILPVFEKPVEVEGEPIAHFRGDKCEYCCIAQSGSEIIFGFNIFQSIGKILSGCIDGLDAYTGLTDSFETPFTDLYECMVFESLKKLHQAVGIPLVCKSFWPDGKKYAVCLTHDVDEVRKTYQYLTGPLKYLVICKFGRAIELTKNAVYDCLEMKNPYWTFDTLMHVEQKLGVKSSLYFLEEKAKVSLSKPKSLMHAGRRYSFQDKKVVEIIKQLDDAGWDVGLHGSYNSYTDPDLYLSEKQHLEKVLGKKVVGGRQHHLNFTYPETWRIHEQSGMEYDATLGLKNKAGFRWGTCMPFHPRDTIDDKQLNLVAIPTTIMDTPLFYMKSGVDKKCEKLRKNVSSARGVLTLLWHHAVFNDREFPGLIGIYEKIITSSINDNAWVTSGVEINNWWRKREKTRLEIEYGESSKVKCECKDNVLLEIHGEGFDFEGVDIVGHEGESYIVKPLGSEFSIIKK